MERKKKYNKHSYDKNKSYWKQYYQEHKEKIQAYQKEYQKGYRERMRARARKRERPESLCMIFRKKSDREAVQGARSVCRGKEKAR